MRDIWYLGYLVFRGYWGKLHIFENEFVSSSEFTLVLIMVLNVFNDTDNVPYEILWKACM